MHIADVTHYREAGHGPIDREARRRTTSAYFPRLRAADAPRSACRITVCSLQPSESRLTKSVFHHLRRTAAESIATRFANSVIQSNAHDLRMSRPAPSLAGAARRICPSFCVANLLKAADTLARRIQARRRIAAGMITLNSLRSGDSSWVKTATPIGCSAGGYQLLPHHHRDVHGRGERSRIAAR